MSATTSTATTGQSSQAGPLAAAAVLAAILAFGALGLAISRGGSTTAADQPAAGAAVDSTSMSGPRSAAQKGLGTHKAGAYSGSEFAGQYKQWLAAQQAGTYSGSDVERQYSHRAAAKKAHGSSSAPAGASGVDSGRISPLVRQPQ
jgi:hypothetical protein